MQTRLVFIASVVTALLGGCIEMPLPDDTPDPLVFKDILNEGSPVTIEELGDGGRRYTWNMSGPESAGLKRFVIVPLEAADVTFEWEVSFDDVAKQDECSLAAAETGVLGRVDPERPSAGSIQWTDVARVRSEAAAGVGISGDLAPLSGSERRSTIGEAAWSVGPEEEVYVTFGSSRGTSLLRDPGQHGLQISLVVSGPSVVLSPRHVLDQGWIGCGAGTDSILVPAARAGIGPVYAVAGAGTGLNGSDSGTSLFWVDDAPARIGEVTIRFLDEVHTDPRWLVRTDPDGGPVGLSFREWVEIDGEKPLWFFSNTYHPWLETATLEGHVLQAVGAGSGEGTS